MSDNVQVTEGSGKTVASDDVDGVQFQRVKLDLGGDGVSTPVTDLSTSAKQDTGNTSVASIDTKTPALGQALAAASVPVVLTAAQITTLTPPASVPADVAPSTQNITTVDLASSSAAGANNQTIIIGNPTANSAATFTLSSVETIRVEVSGIWTGTVATETSIDGGTTWVNQGVHQGAYTTSSFTAGFVGGCNVAGATNFRIRATAAITGTAVVKVIESVNTQSVYVANAAPSGTVISALNTTSATLTSGSVYTGTGEDVTNFSEMRVSTFSDVASATDGLSLQQSSNGTNWDITDTYTVSLSGAGGGKTYVVPRQARYFRVVYTNGGTNQTSFRLQTILNRTATAPSSQRAGDAYTNETDLVQNQSFLMGYNGTTWDRIRTVGTGVVSTSTILTTGSAIIGKVGIDQTTPGTTNLVALTAETTKVLGVVRNADGAGNLFTSNSTTTSAKFSQDKNITSILGTAPTTVGKLDVKGADGDIFVRQATGSNLHTVLDSGTLTTLTTLTGTTTLTPGTGATNLGKAEDAAHTTGDTGVAILAVRDDTLNATSGTEGDYEMFHTTAEGALWVTQAPSVTNGWATFNATSGDGSTALTSTAQQVKGSAGTVGGWYIYNPNASATYVNFYNVLSASVTVGTTNQQMVICVPPTAGANVEFGNGITFATAISISATTTGGGNTAPATALEVNIYYK